MKIRTIGLFAASVALLLGPACGGSGGIDAALSNFEIDLDERSAKSGEVKFNIKNNGPSVHEFVVFKTDLARDQLPTKLENGVRIVDEEGSGVEAIDEKEDIPVNSSTSLTVNLVPGKYVLICNIPDDGGHYSQGMNVDFTVSA